MTQRIGGITSSSVLTVELKCGNPQCERIETIEMPRQPEPWTLPGQWIWFLGPTRLYGRGEEVEIVACSSACAVVAAGNEIANIRNHEETQA